MKTAIIVLLMIGALVMICRFFYQLFTGVSKLCFDEDDCTNSTTFLDFKEDGVNKP